MADSQDDIDISGNEDKFPSESGPSMDSQFVVPADSPSDTLPPFANDENKKLDAAIRDKESELDRLKGELREHTERVAVMQEHLKNVQQEISHTQTLVEAKEKDHETEAHLGALAQREGGRMRADVSALEKQIQSIQDALNGLQASSFKASAQLDAFRETMQWNQEELLQWSLAAKQKDEDQEALQRYMKEDSAKIKALSMRLENATEQLARAKSQLQAEVTETQAAQIELDKTAEQYRQLHLERQQVIRQWDEAKQSMHRRDAAIAKAGEHLLELTNRVRQLEEDAKAANKFLAQEQSRNNQVEQNIGLAERVAGLKRMEVYAASQGMTEFEDEVLAMRNEARKAAAERSAAERENTRLEQEKKEREHQLSELEKQADQTQEQLDTLYAKTDDLEKRSKQVDALHKQHEQRLGEVEKELQTLKSSMFKHSHQLFTLRKLESQLITQISSLQGTSRNLQARIHELDQRSLKQQENLYHVEFQVQQLERKVAYAGGKRSIEETNALNARIEELNKQLEGHTQQFSMLSTQVKRLTDELRASQRKFANLNSEISQLSEKISQMELENDSAQSELGGATKQKETLLVHHDTLKLEIRHLRDTLNSASERVQQLQQRKLDLQLSMAEREKEIEAHMEIQRAELKVAEDARHQVAVDLRERQNRVDKLKQKYAIVAAKLAVPEAALEGMQSMGPADDGSVPRSQAYFVIAAAQEREELQRTGDQLNAEILKAEKEIRMLARSLRVLNDRNTVTRDSLRAADSSSDSVVEKTQLEQQYRQMNETVARKRMMAQEHAGELEQRQAQILQLHKGLSLLQDEVKRLDSDYQQAQSLVQQQEQALGRAIKKMQEVRTKLGPDAPYVDSNTDLSDSSLPLPEAHIALMEQRQRNSTLLTLLQTVAVANPQLEAAISAALEQAGLQFSSRPSTAESSLSAASSVSVPRYKTERKSPTTNIDSVSPRTPNSGSPGGSRKNSARSLINAVNLTLDSVLPPVGGLPTTPDTKGSRASSTASTPKRIPTPPKTAPRSESKRSISGTKPPSSPPSEHGSRPSSRGSLLSVSSRKLELSPNS